MSLKLVSNSNNVVPFPPEHRVAPTVEMVREMAPAPALVASILEERALSLPDMRSAFRSQMAQQASLLEGWLGREGTVLQLRALLDAQLAQAAEACRRYLEAADAMVRLEVRDEAMRSRSPWLAGTLHRELARARAGFRDQAIAARGAADAALGLAEALADYVPKRLPTMCGASLGCRSSALSGACDLNGRAAPARPVAGPTGSPSAACPTGAGSIAAWKLRIISRLCRRLVRDLRAASGFSRSAAGPIEVVLHPVAICGRPRGASATANEIYRPRQVRQAP